MSQFKFYMLQQSRLGTQQPADHPLWNSNPCSTVSAVLDIGICYLPPAKIHACLGGMTILPPAQSCPQIRSCMSQVIAVQPVCRASLTQGCQRQQSP